MSLNWKERSIDALCAVASVVMYPLAMYESSDAAANGIPRERNGYWIVHIPEEPPAGVSKQEHELRIARAREDMYRQDMEGYRERIKSFTQNAIYGRRHEQKPF